MGRIYFRRGALIAIGIVLAVAGCHHKPKDACIEKTGDGFCVDNGAAPAPAD